MESAVALQHATITDQLIDLKKALDNNLLTQEEYDLQRSRVLGTEMGVPVPVAAAVEVQVQVAPSIQYLSRNSTKQPAIPVTGHCPHCKEQVTTTVAAEIGSYGCFKLCLWTVVCCGGGIVVGACDVMCCRCLSKDDVAKQGIEGDICNCVPHDYVHTCPKCHGGCGKYEAVATSPRRDARR